MRLLRNIGEPRHIPLYVLSSSVKISPLGQNIARAALEALGGKSAPTTKKTQSCLQKWLQNIIKESLSAEHKRCWDFSYIGLGRNIYPKGFNLEISCAVLL